MLGEAKHPATSTNCAAGWVAQVEIGIRRNHQNWRSSWILRFAQNDRLSLN